jgi:hypothetical protein
VIVDIAAEEDLDIYGLYLETDYGERLVDLQNYTLTNNT